MGNNTKNWLLNGDTGWRSSNGQQHVSAGPLGIRLDAKENGPLSFQSIDGSLGGLTIPRGFAIGEDLIVHLLVPKTQRVKRFVPEQSNFVEIPDLGGIGSDARQFSAPESIAIAGRTLGVADAGNKSLKIFDLRTLALTHVFGPRDGSGNPVQVDSDDAWDPVDIAAPVPSSTPGRPGMLAILDRRHGRVYRFTPGTDNLTVMVDAPWAAGAWSRVLLDQSGQPYLYDVNERVIISCDSRGNVLSTAHDPQDVRSQFAPPLIALYRRNDGDEGRFCVSKSIARACGRSLDTSPPDQASPLAEARHGALVFDRNGNASSVDAFEPVGMALFHGDGHWASKALDSGIYRCQWHRIEMELGELPPGSCVSVWTLSAQDITAEAPPSTNPGWAQAFHATGPTQAPDTPTGGPREFLIQSREGRYLWIRLVLTGDGYSSPVVDSLRVHYPRESYLDFLPAIFSADDESRWFLQRMLSIFQTEWDAIDARVDTSALYFDPKAVPPGPFLSYLASWLALPLEGTWSEEQKRNLLSAVPKIMPRRGTPDALRDYLRVYLRNMTGIDTTDQGQFPVIMERFRERDRLTLSREAGDFRLGDPTPLWSTSVVNRLQMGVSSEVGKASLVSTGDPQHDYFTEFAHKFRVFVPSGWVRTKDDETMLRRAIETEKPAHTMYELCLIEPRFRVGVQSTIGLDTIIGGIPVARVSCQAERDEHPNRPPRHVLGYDTVLACAGSRGSTPGAVPAALGEHVLPAALPAGDSPALGVDAMLR